MPGSLIAMTDEIKGTDFLSEFGDPVIGHIPHRHTVGFVAEAVVIGYSRNPSQDPKACIRAKRA